MQKIPGRSFMPEVRQRIGFAIAKIVLITIVIAGPDPAIHLLRKPLLKIDGCPDQVRA
jgi:hypothetical protein